MTKKEALQKIAGMVGGLFKYNLKKNKLGLGSGFLAGYAPNKNIGNGLNTMLTSGINFLPGISPQVLSETMKKKSISNHVGDRDQIGEKLRKMRKN